MNPPRNKLDWFRYWPLALWLAGSLVAVAGATALANYRLNQVEIQVQQLKVDLRKSQDAIAANSLAVAVLKSQQSGSRGRPFGSLREGVTP